MTRHAICLLALLLATGCFKDDSICTTYVLKPQVEEVSGDVKRPLEAVSAYAFAADTADWAVASYDDALAGVLTDRTGAGAPSPLSYAAAEPYAYEGATGWIAMPLTEASQMVVVIDREHRLYAYTQQALDVFLPQLYVTLLFQPWRETNSYKSGAWTFRNDFYVAPTELECTLLPSVQSEEGGAEEPVEVRAYAFAADTTRWRVASYADADAGVIRLKEDPEQLRESPNFTAYKQPDGDGYAMSVTASPLFIIVVDRTHGLYAYIQQDVDLEGEPLVLPLLFRPWQQQWITVDEAGWRLVDERYKPEEPGPGGEEDPDNPDDPGDGGNPDDNETTE